MKILTLQFPVEPAKSEATIDVWDQGDSLYLRLQVQWANPNHTYGHASFTTTVTGYQGGPMERLAAIASLTKEAQQEEHLSKAQELIKQMFAL